MTLPPGAALFECHSHARGGNDTVYGGDGNDVIVGGAGNDRIYGGAGNDTATFSGNWSDYRIRQQNDGSFVLSDRRGIDGTDRVYQVETFQFADITLSAGDLLNDAPDAIEVKVGPIAENVAPGTVVGQATAHDPDAVDRLTFSLAEDADGRFTIDAATGQIRIADGALIDFESTPELTIKVLATDADGQSIEQELVIQVEDVYEGEGFDVAWGTPGADRDAPEDSLDGDARRDGEITATIDDAEQLVDMAQQDATLGWTPAANIDAWAPSSDLFSPTPEPAFDWSHVTFGDMQPTVVDAAMVGLGDAWDVSTQDVDDDATLRRLGDDLDDDLSGRTGRFAWLWGVVRAYGGSRRDADASDYESRRQAAARR